MNDIETVQEWLEQEAPKPEELTKDDVFFAWIANDYLFHYYQSVGSKWMKFRGGELQSFHAEDVGWKQASEDVKRGIAVLNGYILWRNSRVPIYRNAPRHPDGIVHRLFGAGYVASTEQHAMYSLVPADDLTTIGGASQIIFGEVNQSNRVKIKNFIRDGELQRFIDKEENNPQKNTRVSRRECVRLKMQLNNS